MKLEEAVTYYAEVEKVAARFADKSYYMGRDNLKTTDITKYEVEKASEFLADYFQMLKNTDVPGVVRGG